MVPRKQPFLTHNMHATEHREKKISWEQFLRSAISPRAYRRRTLTKQLQQTTRSNPQPLLTSSALGILPRVTSTTLSHLPLSFYCIVGSNKRRFSKQTVRSCSMVLGPTNMLPRIYQFTDLNALFFVRSVSGDVFYHTSTLETWGLPETDLSLCVWAHFDFRDTTRVFFKFDNPLRGSCFRDVMFCDPSSNLLALCGDMLFLTLNPKPPNPI